MYPVACNMKHLSRHVALAGGKYELWGLVSSSGVAGKVECGGAHLTFQHALNTSSKPCCLKSREGQE